MKTLELVESKLGRKLDPQARGRISNLNEVPESIVEQARALGSPLLAESLLGYLTAQECQPFLQSYVQDVVFGNTPPQTWRRGRILVPSLSLEQQLIRNRAEILAPVGGEFSFRTIPDLEAWKAGISWVGAPAKPEPDADYRSPVPEGSASLVIVPVEHVADPVVALRRWIAARVARVSSASGRLDTASDLSELAPGLPPPDSWSSDARSAASALLMEMRELGPPIGDIPGFRGPDSWYRDE